MPTAVAVSVVIPDVPPIFKTPVAPCVTPPVPDKAAVAVIVPLFVNLIAAPVTVNSVELEMVPLLV